MIRFVTVALAAISLLSGIAVSHSAEARCFWNGFERVCTHHRYPGFANRSYVWGYHRDFDRPVFYWDSYTNHGWR